MTRAGFFSRMANEASMALSDAYGHVMHGDDAGSSAKLVWVVHPINVPINNNSDIAAMESSGGGGGVGVDGGNNSNPQSPGRENNNGSNYLHTQKFDLGLTFIEINDRAYVRTVDPNSLAEKAGIQPQDCVQFACVVGGPQFDTTDSQQHGRKTSSSSLNRRRNSSRTSEIEYEKQLLDSKATKYVLECEKRGMRISYQELRDLFAGCTLPPKKGLSSSIGGGGENNNSGNGNVVGDTKKSETTSPMITPPRLGGGGGGMPQHKSNNNKGLHHQNDNDDCYTIGSNSLMLADSVGGMFERNKKNENNTVSSRRVPLHIDKMTAKNVTLNVTNAARNSVGRCFEGDDDQVRRNDYDRQNSNNSNMLMDTPLSPIKSDNVNNMISSPSSPRSTTTTSAYGDGLIDDNIVAVEQSLYPVVMVFRRTVQRRHILSPTSSSSGNVNRGYSSSSSSGLSLKGSLFGIPSFRMDDECDRAAALIRQLIPPPPKKGSSKGGGMMEDVFCSNPSSNHDEQQEDGGASCVAPTSPKGGGSSSNVNDDIEASTIRGMIGAAVGLGFVRLSKVVVGVSLQGGSGIIISRLPDGTWSAPSAMGVYGLGVGLQFGLEVADFMFIIQTDEGMEHFKRGGNFVVGGNIGAAVVNCGREAYGAASLGVCSGNINQIEIEDDEMENYNRDDGASQASISTGGSTYASTMQSTVNNKQRQSQQSKNKKKDNDIAPMVAYAKSQGLYFGVSVDGLKFFTRNDINSRTYKFAMLSEMPAKDILSGLVLPPPEAEDLYSALHSVEYTHEIIELPRPPEMLQRDSMNDWRFDRSIAAARGEIVDSNDNNRKSGTSYPPYSFLSSLNREEAGRFAQFETKFKKFLYGGVSVQHLMPHSALTRSGMTRREKRTLWLMLPEVGSLRLGFVSKLKDDGETMDDVTVASSVASSIASHADDNETVLPEVVHLSKKNSVSLTDVTILSQDPNVTVRLSPDDATEHLRVLSIHDVTGKSILFLANSNKEAELLFCGLKLLLECETARLSVRGGVPINKLGGKLRKGALSPQSARGTLQPRIHRRERSDMNKHRHSSRRGKEDLDNRSKYSSFGEPGTSSDESDSNDKEDSEASEEIVQLSDRHQVPEGRQSWSQLPGRNKMRQFASGTTASPRGSPQSPTTYELGKVICTDIATNISLPLPLAMCRVLFLDSASPVNRTWESGRADTDYRHSSWAFPPGSVREFERDDLPEQQIISHSSMVGAQRSISYTKMRNREPVRLFETISVEQDDERALIFVITDQMPRRGFSAKARIQLRSFGSQSCEARVVTEIRPVGKNLSNQEAVHKAFILVLDEMNKRYGVEEKGLLAVFLDVYNTLPVVNGGPSPRRSHAGSSTSLGNKAPTTITSFKDVLPSGKINKENSTAPGPIPGNRSSSTRFNGSSATTIPPSQLSPRRPQKQTQERPSTPSMRTIDKKTIGVPQPKAPSQSIVENDEFADFKNFEDVPRNPVTVEVKPLPKIRLDLCPVPREEDEEELSSVADGDAKQKRKSKSSKRRHRSAGRNR